MYLSKAVANYDERGCGEKFGTAERDSIYVNLEAYFNGNRAGNLFNWILEEDLETDYHLGRISDILSAKSCSLEGYARGSMLVCLRNTVIYPAAQAQFWDNSLYLGDLEAEWAALLVMLEAMGDSLSNNGEMKGGMVQMMSSVPPSLSEFSALLALYSATGGNNWINNYGWAEAFPYYPEDVTVPGDWNNTGFLPTTRIWDWLMSICRFWENKLLVT